MATVFSDQNAMMSSLNSLRLLDPEDIIFNDMIQIHSESPIHSCGNCNAGKLATSRCRDCNKYMCDNCVVVHSKIWLTKDHCILKISGSPIVLSPFIQEHSPQGSTVCERHANEINNYFCETCRLAICNECVINIHRGHAFVYINDAIENSATACNKLLSESKLGIQAIKDSLEKTQRMIEANEIRANLVTKEISLVSSKLFHAINERVSELFNKVDNIRNIKNQILVKQAEGLKKALNNLIITTKQLSEVIEIGTPVDLLNAKVQVLEEYKHLTRTVRIGFSPQEDDTISFRVNDFEFSRLLRANATFGEVNAVSFNQCSLVEGFITAPENSVIPRARLNKSYEEFLGNHDSLISYIGNSENCLLKPDLEDRRECQPFQFNKDCPIMVGQNFSLLQNNHLNTHVFPVCIYNNRKYSGNSTFSVSLTFGKEGDGDGELCRPWGVCCDKEGNIIVADRSNNRIQIFKSNGLFIRKFGKHGNEPGQFDRPAGVATNPLNHIVVADKDNHRIQIFKPDGQFLFTFGDKGSKNGQFNYPWDVDVNSEGLIVVSDTRNHRIQVFKGDGSFISKYGFENTSGMWRHFDSPRGVCFAPNSSIVVTDFNNHRLIVIEHNCMHARFLGAEGSGIKQFLRPQGVAVDVDGHFIVADSRNNRIQIFENSGNFTQQFGVAGNEPGHLDRPSGVCISPDGKIVVVDFGNNRIQVFE